MTVRHISKEVINFVKQQRRLGTALAKQSLPDVKLIAAAEDKTASETIKVPSEQSAANLPETDFPTQLLKLILLAAISSRNGDRYLQRIVQLSKPAQEQIRNMIEDVRCPGVFFGMARGADGLAVGATGQCS